MTANAAGSSFAMQSSLPSRAITAPLKPYSPRIPSFKRSCARSIAHAKKVESFRKETAIATSKLEAQFALILKANKLPTATREYRFDAVRMWRFDFAWPDQKVAVELEGGLWNGGRHTRAAGFIADAEKYNAAQIQGWLVLRFAAPHLKDGSALAMTKQALGA